MSLVIFDKTLNFPNSGSQTTVSQTTVSQTSSADTQAINQPISSLPADNLPAKKVFKNLTNTKPNIGLDVELVNKKSDTALTETMLSPATMPPAAGSLFANINTNLMIIAIASLVMLIAAAVALKKYRQRMFASFTDAIPTMSDSLQDFGGHWKDEAQEIDQQTLLDIEHPFVKWGNG